MPHFWVPNTNLVSDGTLLTPGVVQGGEKKHSEPRKHPENIGEITKLSIPPSIPWVWYPSLGPLMSGWSHGPRNGPSWWFQHQPI